MCGVKLWAKKISWPVTVMMTSDKMVTLGLNQRRNRKNTATAAMNDRMSDGNLMVTPNRLNNPRCKR